MIYVLLFTVVANGHIKQFQHFGDVATADNGYHSLALCESDRVLYEPQFKPKRGVKWTVHCEAFHGPFVIERDED